MLIFRMDWSICLPEQVIVLANLIDHFYVFMFMCLFSCVLMYCLPEQVILNVSVKLISERTVLR